MDMAISVVWRSEIEAVEFFIGGDVRVVVHRNVFRTLCGAPQTPQACLDYVVENEAAFRLAAHARLRDARPDTRAFHLNSRQVRSGLCAAVPAREPAPR